MRQLWKMAAVLCFGMALMISSGAYPQSWLEEEPTVTDPPITVTAIFSHVSISPGSEGRLAIQLDIPPEFHVRDDVMVSLENAEGILPSGFYGPKAVESEESQFAYHYDKPYFVLPFTISPDASTGERNVTVQVEYSPCTDTFCFAPTTRTTEAKITVAASDEINPDFTAIEAALPTPPARIAVGAGSETGEDDLSGSYTSGSTGISEKLGKALSEGSWLAFLLAFLGGLAASFTPCVYPMIPITVSYFGSRNTGSLSRGFLMSLVYVLGIAITYSVLGAIAGGTGLAFGGLSENPLVIIFVVVLLLVLAASMFGAFELQLPSGVTSRLLKGGLKRGILAPLFLGLILGFVAAPCLGPVLITILTFIAQKQSVFYGFLLMFFFALGMGVLFVVIGTFSGAIEKLPRSGAWMITVKKIFGAMMVGMAIYFLRPLLSPSIYGYIVAVAFIVFGAFAGAFTRLCEKPSVWDNIRKVAGVIAATIGIYGLVVNMIAAGLFMPPGLRFGPASPEKSGMEIDWRTSFDRALEEAKAQNKPIMIDTYKENCAACIELDRYTYSDPAVIKASEGFIPVKLYEPDNKDVLNTYGAKGSPTIVFLDPNGNKLTKNVVGFVEADMFLEIMETAKRRFSGDGS